MDPLTQSAYDDWQCLLREARADDPRCQAFLPLLEVLADDPLARRVFPHLSMWTLRFSRCPDYPFDIIFPDVDLHEEHPGCYRLDDGPPLDASVTLAAILPGLQKAEVYPGNIEA